MRTLYASHDAARREISPVVAFPCDRRWCSTDASKHASREGGVLVDGAVSKTARLVGFNSYAPCSHASAPDRQQQRNRQRLQRQRGAVTARFTASARTA